MNTSINQKLIPLKVASMCSLKFSKLKGSKNPRDPKWKAIIGGTAPCENHII